MLSATHLIAQLRKGERTVRDSVHGSLITIEGQQDRLNTATFIDSERALARADELDDSENSKGGSRDTFRPMSMRSRNGPESRSR